MDVSSETGLVFFTPTSAPAPRGSPRGWWRGVTCPFRLGYHRSTGAGQIKLPQPEPDQGRETERLMILEMGRHLFTSVRTLFTRDICQLLFQNVSQLASGTGGLLLLLIFLLIIFFPYKLQPLGKSWSKECSLSLLLAPLYFFHSFLIFFCSVHQ